MESVFEEGGNRRSREPARILLAGFASDQAKSIVDTLNKVGWTSLALLHSEEASAAFRHEWFDMTLVDVGHINVFAPAFVSQLRSCDGESAGSLIVATDEVVPTHLKSQLLQSGADLVVAKPSDPAIYACIFTEASVLRLNSFVVRKVESER